MAVLDKQEARKERQSRAGVTRANNSTCPGCQRKNAYFKVADDDMCIVRQCRYCKYSRYTDKATLQVITTPGK